MITAVVCSCGKAFSPERWAALPFKGYQDDEPEPLALRNCPCGSTRALSKSDDHTCKLIAQIKASRRFALVHARMCLALVRLHVANANADGARVQEEIVEQHLREARGHREDAQRLLGDLRYFEGLLKSSWRAREEMDPSARIGRTLTLVDAPAAGAR